MKHLFHLLLLFLLGSCTTNIYLVRHAEKLNTTANTPLSDSGQLRALALRDSLHDNGIEKIFVSTFLRTQQTAAPLATAEGIAPVIYNKDTSLALAAKLKRGPGAHTLVVGHSDNIPQIIQHITGEAVTIGETDFDNLFIISITRDIAKTRIRLRKTTYGAFTPP